MSNDKHRYHNLVLRTLSVKFQMIAPHHMLEENILVWYQR
jgi:hypothetical protein